MKTLGKKNKTGSACTKGGGMNGLKTLWRGRNQRQMWRVIASWKANVDEKEDGIFPVTERTTGTGGADISFIFSRCYYAMVNTYRYYEARGFWLGGTAPRSARGEEVWS